MPLKKEDSGRVNYKAQIDWYRQRIASLQTGFINPSVKTNIPDAEEYRSVLTDITKKISKMNDRIDHLSINMRIPVSKDKDPEVYSAVKALDPQSGGEFISYALYKSLAEKLESARSKIKIDDLIENYSDDPVSNSQLIQDRLYSGYVETPVPQAPGDNAAQRYVNRYLNNLVSWNEGDYQIRQIMNFADNYLNKFPDPAYVPWAFKSDVVFESTNAKSFQELWNNFSAIGKNEVNRFGESLKKLTELKPDGKIADVTDRYLDYTNKWLNGLNDLLNENWATSLVCCFVKYVIRVDEKTLKGIRALLQLLRTGIGFDFTELINSIKDVFNNIMRGILLNSLMAIVTQIAQRLADPIRKWINNPNDPNWQKVFDCLPVRELIEKYIAEAIDYVQNFINELLTDLYKELEIKNIYSALKLSYATESTWLNRAIKLLDIAIAALEASAQCGINQSPNAEDVQRVMNSYGAGTATPQYVYVYEENPNIYNSFITAEQQKAIEDGTLSKEVATYTSAAPIVSTNQTTPTSAMADLESDKVKDCMKNIRNEDMPKAIAWIEEITRQSQGRV